MSEQFGVSFSLKYAYEMGIDPQACLEAALNDLGVKRLRLMSYWDLHEPERLRYNFAQLDWQINMAEQVGASISLCLGLRQPRWPESHWPAWARDLPKDEWQQALMDYIKAVVTRYEGRRCIVSWQLENEARLKSFGENGDFDRGRLRREMALVRRLDPSKRPVIMTLSDSWGIPFFEPKPDLYAMSIYRHFYDRGEYRRSQRPAWFYHLRALLIRAIEFRRTFIHELQAEPWGPRATIELPLEEQYKSMDLTRVQEALAIALKTKMHPIDIWGLEWWYWLKTTQNQSEIWDFIRQTIAQTR